MPRCETITWAAPSRECGALLDVVGQRISDGRTGTTFCEWTIAAGEEIT